MVEETEKVGSDRVHPFLIIASFPARKNRSDKQYTLLENKLNEINVLIGTYQLDGDEAYAFSRDKRYAFFSMSIPSIS